MQETQKQASQDQSHGPGYMGPPNHDGDGGGNHKKQKESRNAMHDEGFAR
jgi:hypothetical protein